MSELTGLRVLRTFRPEQPNENLIWLKRNILAYKTDLSGLKDHSISNPSNLELYHFESRTKSSVSVLEKPLMTTAS